MTIQDVLVADLKATLEETANIMADRIILEALAKNGSVTLEEAEFYNSLAHRVVMEASDEFVPDSLELEESEVMRLTGEDGTVYMYDPATGQLTPVDGAEGSEPAGEGKAEGMDQLQPEEGAEAQGKDEDLKESEEAQGEVELTESQAIVANLIKSLV